MTVYVDDMQAPFGRMKMCHCWADTRDELFAMMRLIGVQLKWFQRPVSTCDVSFGMEASWEHFDISMTKRALAVRNGAIETDMFTMAEHANLQQFVALIAINEFASATHALRMMCLASNSRSRRHD